MSDYSQGGGVLPGGLTKVTIDVAECIVRVDDVLAGRSVCCRTDDAHLTAAHPEHHSAEGEAS